MLAINITCTITWLTHEQLTPLFVAICLEMLIKQVLRSVIGFNESLK